MSIDSGRAKYLESMDLAGLARRAHELLAKMTIGDEWVAKVKSDLSDASEAVEVQRARILLSPAYKESGPNETIRGAWLLQQQRDDGDYAGALHVYRGLRNDLDAAEAAAEAVAAEYKLVLTEIRLAAAQLAFMAE